MGVNVGTVFEEHLGNLGEAFSRDQEQRGKPEVLEYKQFDKQWLF